MFTTAPGFFGGPVNLRTKLSLASLWLAAIALVTYLALARPDLSPVADWIERTFISA